MRRRSAVLPALSCLLLSATAACAGQQTATPTLAPANSAPAEPSPTPGPTSTRPLSPSASASSPSTAPSRPTQPSDFNPKNFSHPTQITNRYFPLVPGTRSRWTGHAYDDGERVSREIESTVTDLTKTVAGVRTVVGWDRDITNGQAEEVELTFYAQDDDGSVWYFGEYSEEYDDQRIVKSPAWLAGRQGARAGIMMPAEPRTGTPGYAEGWGPRVHWSDRGKVDQVGIRDCVPVDCYSDVVVIDEFNPDEPGRHQLKYYAPGIGGIRTGWRGKHEEEKEELELDSLQTLTDHTLADVRQDALDQERRAYERSPHLFGPTEHMTKG